MFFLDFVKMFMLVLVLLTPLVQNLVLCSLILLVSFVYASVFMFQLGLEFLPLLFILIGAGSASILILFSIMIVGYKSFKWNKVDNFNLNFYYVIFLSKISVLSAILVEYTLDHYEILNEYVRNLSYNFNPTLELSFLFDDIKIFCLHLYTDFGLHLILSGVVLLVATIISLVLTE